MSNQPDPSAIRRPSIGILAVQFGLISQKQLMECLDLQRGAESDKDLDDILVGRGLLTRDAIDKLFRSYDESVLSAPPKPPSDSVTGRQTRKQTRVNTRMGAPGTAKRTTSVGAQTRARGTATRQVEDKVAAHRRHVMQGAILALTPLALLGAYLVYAAFAPEPSAGAGSGVKRDPVIPPPPPPPPPSTTAQHGTGQLRADVRPLAGSNDIVDRWNVIVEHIKQCRDPEQYKPVLRDLEQLVTDSKAGPYEGDIRAGYRKVIEAMNARGEQVFGFLSDEHKRLSEAGRFGDAIRAWDWFPGTLDPGGKFATQIEGIKKQTLETGRRQYEGKRVQSEKLAAERKYDQAKLVMLQALEMGLAEFTDDAYALVSKYTESEDSAARAAEEAQLEEFTKKSRAERELAQRATALRAQFWEMVTRRRIAQVGPFLARQREGAPPDVVREIEHLEKCLGDVRGAFAAVGSSLARQRGRQVSVAFVDGFRSLSLTDVDRGEILYTVEGREFRASLYDLAASEVERAAGEQKDPERQALLRGVAALLEEDFAKAHAALTEARGEGATLLSFVERSTAFLEKNAGQYRERAQKFMDAKEWDRAALEYTRLTALPSERKAALRGRAKAYFYGGNYVGTVLDVEQLFELDDYSAEVIDLLNQSYQRATLISKAVQIYESARKRVPENGGILGSLLMLYLRIHEFQKARDTLASAKKISGVTVDLARAVHELQTLEENPFPGQVHVAKFGRYDVMTNVSQKYANEMAQFMDKVYKDYVKVFPFKKNETLRFHVKLFATEGEFFAYCRKGGMTPSTPLGKVLAFYNPSLKELVGWNQGEEILETMTHEGLHQYIDYFVDDCPIWFNEGYASYFEKSTADEPRFNPERHRTALGLLHMKQLPRLKELMLMSGQTFREGGALHYGSSWAAIFYLVKTGQKPLLDRYFEELMLGKTQQQAFDAVFAKIDLDALETRWRKAIFNEEYEK